MADRHVGPLFPEQHLPEGHFTDAEATPDGAARTRAVFLVELQERIFLVPIVDRFSSFSLRG